MLPTCLRVEPGGTGDCVRFLILSVAQIVQIYGYHIVVQDRSVTQVSLGYGQGVSRAMLLFGGSRIQWISCLLQLLEATCVPQLVTCS